MRKYPRVMQLAKKFRIKVRKTTPIIKGVYRIELFNRKQYALKSMPYPSSQLRWIDKTLQRVKEQGFSRIAWRRPQNKEEKILFVRLNNRPYVLNPWIQGRWPNPKSQKDMRACGVALARFHKVGLSVKIPKAGEFNTISKWPSELNAKHFMLKKQINKARQNGFKSTLDLFLQRHGEELLNYSNNAMRLLRTSNYKSACIQARKSRSLCHGDGGPTNFIINKIGTHLIDFETLRLDLRSYDLYRVIYNSCKDHGWNFSIVRALLDGYQQVSKLNYNDFELMKVWLRFPRTTDLLLNKHRRSGKKGKFMVLQKMGRALAAERKITSFLHKLDLYANR